MNHAKTLNERGDWRERLISKSFSHDILLGRGIVQSNVTITPGVVWNLMERHKRPITFLFFASTEILTFVVL